MYSTHQVAHVCGAVNAGHVGLRTGTLSHRISAPSPLGYCRGSCGCIRTYLRVAFGCWLSSAAAVLHSMGNRSHKRSIDHSLCEKSPDMVYESLEQPQNLAGSNVHTNIRMTAIKLSSGGLLIYAPIAPTRRVAVHLTCMRNTFSFIRSVNSSFAL